MTPKSLPQSSIFFFPFSHSIPIPKSNLPIFGSNPSQNRAKPRDEGQSTNGGGAETRRRKAETKNTVRSSKRQRMRGKGKKRARWFFCMLILLAQILIWLLEGGDRIVPQRLNMEMFTVKQPGPQKIIASKLDHQATFEMTKHAHEGKQRKTSGRTACTRRVVFGALSYDIGKEQRGRQTTI